jgi:hypothetical protein
MCSSLHKEKIDALAREGHSEEWSSNSNTSANSKPCVQDDLGHESGDCPKYEADFLVQMGANYQEGKFPSHPDGLTSHSQICPVFGRIRNKKISSRGPT